MREHLFISYAIEDWSFPEWITRGWTLEDLEGHNKLVTERRSLKRVILDMEGLVLANADVDAFDEVFRLVYARLYDEWQVARGGETQ